VWAGKKKQDFTVKAEGKKKEEEGRDCSSMPLLPSLLL
jgi:hypothetical protein